MMTWHETHARTRIMREVEAIAATDLTGALPWRTEWNTYFDGPAGLVQALRSRWHRMCEPQLDSRMGEDAFADNYRRLRRTEAGVLAILRRVDAGAAPEDCTIDPPLLAGATLWEPLDPAEGAGRHERGHRLSRRRVRGGPVLPV